ncbi:KpsF/GutQ family sugar-phosphate isomerase [Roseospirillum parvum]|uniref:Arabinose-5-phosphate isomerase n=1 Tax=Roseospirillum parvum TaxID=83401 RepID=A0A1G8B8K8_9PROT|nr:KpsF/GutQ family sugar-phosphate isomerase [Roseospirillum parvum]SDH29353.1 arabinose-5-phosphate isomerase [Roseospirillum parvum]
MQPSAPRPLANPPSPSDAAPEVATARRVLATEATALGALADSLGPSFVAAVDLIDRAAGRAVVSGMGKSGHVGRKIAATLASTGSPAFFVHPAEASHGDLGMITRDDVVIGLSNSGETAELADLLGYTRRHGIGLIALTGRPDSTLARTAEVVLALPPVTEACPHGLAPTTSTTLMMALGDALAVALLERRGFTAADFQGFHPGGQLGRRLLLVRDLMHGGPAMPLVGRDTPMREALLVMTRASLGCVGVKGPDGRLLGIVTDGDLRRHMSPELLAKSVGEVMSPRPKTIRESALASEALKVMNDLAITSLFVHADGADADSPPAGILHIHDLLRAGLG